MKRPPKFPKKCPFCGSPVEREPTLQRANSWSNLSWSMVHYACGTAFRPEEGATRNSAGRQCSAYGNPYPLPPHLAKIHLSGLDGERKIYSHPVAVRKNGYYEVVTTVSGDGKTRGPDGNAVRNEVIAYASTPKEADDVIKKFSELHGLSQLESTVKKPLTTRLKEAASEPKKEYSKKLKDLYKKFTSTTVPPKNKRERDKEDRLISKISKMRSKEDGVATLKENDRLIRMRGRTTPGIIQCDCGRKIEVYDSHDVECDRCHAEYNSSGQALKQRPSWNGDGEPLDPDDYMRF